MHFFKATTLVAALSTFASASNPPDPTITDAPSPDLIKARGLLDLAGKTCPGVLFADIGSTSGCCIGGTVKINLSTCPGWPICTGSATQTGIIPPLSCASVVDPDDNDYKSKVSEASRSMEASGTVYKTVVGSGEISGGGITKTGSDNAALPKATGAAGLAGMAALAGAAAAFL